MSTFNWFYLFLNVDIPLENIDNKYLLIVTKIQVNWCFRENLISLHQNIMYVIEKNNHQDNYTMFHYIYFIIYKFIFSIFG